MAVVAGPDGSLLLLDQVNARISHFDADGKLLKTVPIGPDTAQDLAIDADGKMAVIDRVGEGQLILYDEEGQASGQVPLEGGPLTEAGGVTGVFMDETGTYVEREHTESVHLTSADGTPDPDRPPTPGRPTRSGEGYVSALVTNRAGGAAAVRMFSRDRDLLWQRPVSFSSPIMTLIMLDSDRTGHVYMAAHLGEEQPNPPYAIVNERIVVVRMIESDGTGTGSLVLPPPTAAEESFRPLSVSDEGVIYQMLAGPNGVQVRAYTFP